MEKNEILKKFSSEPQRYYTVDLFEDSGFTRKSCRTCGRFFWTLDPDRVDCPDDAPDTYSFIGDPPTKKRFDYTESWKQISSFFSENKHDIIGRYPVVCRWRDDLYFTIASIVDFQRVMGSKVVFEFPANPLVVPQTCLRFKDLENVGVTGRHFSSFCMVGQHCIPDIKGGYWKDECIRLDYELLTRRFGINPAEIVFVEDVWAGGGSFGPSLEYFVRGLELGNAVFTEFQGTLENHTTLDNRIIDMGAGLERFAWITMGTPTAYDCCFGNQVDTLLKDAIGFDADAHMLKEYYTGVAKMLERSDDLWTVRKKSLSTTGISEQMASNIITPLEDVYMIADHLRTLIFAIADGALPSNVGGGYNLRMMIRRVNERIHKLRAASHLIDVDDIVDAHITYLANTYPELIDKRDDVKKILHIESDRYLESRLQMQKKISRVRERNQTPDMNTLVTLYESDGITPEYLVDEGVLSEVPSAFYTRISELHQSRKIAPLAEIALDDIPDTELLFYNSDPFEFDATVLWYENNKVVLDRTSFYARGGGQEPDHGTIANFDVIDVEKHANIIVHILKSGTVSVGERVHCIIDKSRRDAITKHHTSTHIINASSRHVLGSWVWQHSAFKDADHARLDITHHSPLSTLQVKEIEDTANQMIRDDLAVSIQYMERGDAEQKYGFRIYQGGIVPVKAVRIVSISDKDIEACGGTHVSSTGKIQKIRITRTKRIQDGVVRIEFVSGDVATLYDEKQKYVAKEQRVAETKREETLKRRELERETTRELVPDLVNRISNVASGIHDVGGVAVFVSYVDAFSNSDTNHNNNNNNTNHTNYPHHPNDDNDNNVATADITTGNQSTNTTNTHFIKICMLTDYDRDERFHMSLGKLLTKHVPNSAYVGFFTSGPTTRVVSYVGPKAITCGIDASKFTALAADILGGGSSGNNMSLSKGGGPNSDKRDLAVESVKSEIMQILSL